MIHDIIFVMKKINKFQFWSNLFFLVPLIYSLINKVWWYSVIVLVATAISFIYHFNKKNKFSLYIDSIFSRALIVANIFLLFFGHWKMPYGLLALISATLALSFYFIKNKRNRDIDHGLWHFFSSLVCFFCLATYLTI